jgi:hypothetical protein
MRMDLGEVEWEGVDWINLGQDRNQWQVLENVVIELQVPKKVGNFLTS